MVPSGCHLTLPTLPGSDLLSGSLELPAPRTLCQLFLSRFLSLWHLTLLISYLILKFSTALLKPHAFCVCVSHLILFTFSLTTPSFRFLIPPIFLFVCLFPNSCKCSFPRVLFLAPFSSIHVSLTDLKYPKDTLLLSFMCLCS